MAATQSILNSVKEVLGIALSETVFDQSLITHINSVFTILHQLGVGPSTGFSIDDGTDLWSSFLSTEESYFGLVKSYVGLKVQSLFDPPTAGSVSTAMKSLLEDFENRICAQVTSIQE